MQVAMGLGAIAAVIADGGTRSMACPHNGPDCNILVTGEKGKEMLVSCDALSKHRTSGDGRGCLYLHNNSSRPCPYFEQGGVIAQGEGFWPGL